MNARWVVVSIVLLSFFQAAMSVAADLRSSTPDKNSIIGAYGGYGVGLPNSISAGVNYSIVRVGVSIPALKGSSIAYTLGFQGRSRDHLFSPVLGVNFTYNSVKPGEIFAAGYDDGRKGVMVLVNLGMGLRLGPDYYIDGGLMYSRGIGALYPYGAIVFPLSK